MTRSTHDTQIKGGRPRKVICSAYLVPRIYQISWFFNSESIEKGSPLNHENRSAYLVVHICWKIPSIYNLAHAYHRIIIEVWLHYHRIIVALSNNYHCIITELSWNYSKYHWMIIELSLNYHEIIIGLSWHYHWVIMDLSWKYHKIIIELS